MEVQLQSHNVIRRCAVRLRCSGCLKNYSLPTNGNLGANDVPATQSSFDICRLKRVDIHRIYQERLRSVCGYVSFPHDATEAFHRVHPRITARYTRASPDDRRDSPGRGLYWSRLEPDCTRPTAIAGSTAVRRDTTTFWPAPVLSPAAEQLRCRTSSSGGCQRSEPAIRGWDRPGARTA
jgi:hypothetical protein